MARVFLAAAVLAVLFFTACNSCAMDPEVVSIFGGDLSVPKLVDVHAVSPAGISASFSSPVSISSAQVVVQDSAGEVVPVVWQTGKGPTDIVFEMNKVPGIGVHAVLSAIVTDDRGDSLSFAAPFTGYNSRVPRLRISEIRTDYSRPKVEYIELYALTGGNLGGVEIFNAMNATNPVRELPAAEVNAGDYIVWHFRSVEEGLVNETAAITVSGGVDACLTARDFWDTQTKAPFKKTNVILLRERKGGAIMDALLCTEDNKAVWPNDTVRLAAEEAVAAGAWKPGALATDAAFSAGMTLTRTLGRNETEKDTDTAADWKVCPTGKCSPGRINASW